MLKLKDRKRAIKGLAEELKRLMKGEETITIMHLCGTHEDTITRYNLRSLLPKNLKVVSGPGCPVCITPDTDLQRAFHLLEKENVILTTFGDMARVPFEGKSFFYYKSKGYDVRIVYSVFDALEIAKVSDKPVVFFAIGFETTMPSTAVAVLDEVDNFYVLSAHRFFIPAMEHLLSFDDVRIDGFICPGHVSTIVGVKAYEHIKVPQVIAGFEPEDVLLALCMLVKAIKNGENCLLNEYTRAVRYEGNVKAQEVMKEVFGRDDWEWRGLGVVKNSGAPLRKKYEDFDALKVFEDAFKDFEPKEDRRKRLCRCGDVLRGVATPLDCPLFMKACTPKNPIGACMVSFEGTCNIWAKYWRG